MLAVEFQADIEAAFSFSPYVAMRHMLQFFYIRVCFRVARAPHTPSFPFALSAAAAEVAAAEVAAAEVAAAAETLTVAAVSDPAVRAEAFEASETPAVATPRRSGVVPAVL